MMTKVTINYDPKLIKEIIKSINKYNALPKNDYKRDFQNLINRFSAKLNDKPLAQIDDLEANDNNRIEYWLTIVPEWCLNQNTLEGAEEDDMQFMFDEYYQNNLSNKPTDKMKANTDLMVLCEDLSVMTSYAISLDDFKKQLKHLLDDDFDGLYTLQQELIK